jgi:isoleucyl-tRNA synthetase
VLAPLPDKPDHDALEQEILALWEREGTFERLRAQNAEGPRFSFFDGPVTANKALAVHTAWGRTLKDVFQRYKALRGYHQRYQNGFDCQGLWIEVGVERELGLNSKRDIEEFGLEEFARKCREVVVWSSEELTKGSIRLGQWMDWGNDYFTFSDTNIEYVWRMLKTVHERDWLYLGHRSTEWCPRCGTSISQHELTMSGVYQDRADPSLTVRFPLLERSGESLVIWTTTPWTLPANVAAAVNPDAEYGRRATGEWVAVARYPDESFVETLRGSEMVGWRYSGPFDTLPPGAAVEHRVVAWDEVSLEEGTGVVHIAPGCGGEDFELGKEEGLAVLTPVDEAGHFYDEYGWLHGLSTAESADQIVGDLKERGLIVEAGLYEHRYPHCWRCDTPLIFRIADDWLISVRDLRPQMLDANATVEWTPAYMGKRMDDWLRNMGDWNISRRRYYGLPLPIYPCVCGHVNVIGSRAELEERALAGLDQLEELRRPWIDRVPISCEACGDPVERVKEVGDVWLDAGIVPFSTLGWENAERVPEGYATTRTGRSGSQPIGCRRCVSRSGSGSTRSCSCRSCSRSGRRSGRCSGTRRCSTRPGVRCTVRGGT